MIARISCYYQGSAGSRPGVDECSGLHEYMESHDRGGGSRTQTAPNRKTLAVRLVRPMNPMIPNPCSFHPDPSGSVLFHPWLQSHGTNMAPLIQVEWPQDSMSSAPRS
jgi:hypothetical protein